MKKSLAVTLVLVFAATSSFAQSRGGHSGGGRGGGGNGGGHGGGRGGGGHGGGGGHAVSRGHAPGRGHSGAVARHPSPGGGHSYSRGHGHGYYGHGSHGGSYYGRGYYGRGYYGGSYYGRGYGYGYSRYRSYPYYGGYYPYYGYGYGYGYGYYPWAYGLGLGLSLSLDSGYADTGYRASYEPEYARASEPRRSEPAEYSSERDGNGAEMAELRFVVGPGDASVYVDDEFRGLASRLVGVRVTPGPHRVEVVRPGYAVAQREVHVGRGATASVQIDLERR